MNDYYWNLFNSPYLAHHGIKGQKWGVRRYQNKDGSYNTVGYRRYADRDHGDETSDSGDKKHSTKKVRGLTSGQKKAIAIGAVAVGSVLAAYGLYKLNKSGKLDGLKQAFKKSNESIAEDEGFKRTGLKKLTKHRTTEEQLKAVNPSHSQDNCKQVSNALAENLTNHRDSIAIGENSIKGNLHDYVEQVYEEGGGIVHDVSGDSSNIKRRLEKNILKNCNEGDAGAVNLTFDHKYLAPNSVQDAHAFTWQIENGKVNWLDGQGEKDGTVRTSKDIERYFRCVDPNKQAEWVNYHGRHIKKDQVGKVIGNRV